MKIDAHRPTVSDVHHVLPVAGRGKSWLRYRRNKNCPKSTSLLNAMEKEGLREARKGKEIVEAIGKEMRQEICTLMKTSCSSGDEPDAGFAAKVMFPKKSVRLSQSGPPTFSSFLSSFSCTFFPSGRVTGLLLDFQLNTWLTKSVENMILSSEIGDTYLNTAICLILSRCAI